MGNRWPGEDSSDWITGQNSRRDATQGPDCAGKDSQNASMEAKEWIDRMGEIWKQKDWNSDVHESLNIS